MSGETLLDIRDRLRPRWPAVLPGQTTVDEQIAETEAEAEEPAVISRDQARQMVGSSAFAVESKETGKIVLAVPVEREAAAVSAEDFLLRLSGRLVEAEKANANGAFWSQGDLEFGLPSVAYGPLNWLHQERKVVGVLTNASLVRPTPESASVSSSVLTGPNVISTNGLTAEAALAWTTTTAANLPPLPMRKPVNSHVRADAVVWKWLYPDEAREVERASEARQLWYSMECIAREVECVGERGCGKRIDYRERSSANACSHIREHSAARRLVDPIFQGAAIIVPPVKPGWADADLEVAREAAAVVEDNQLDLGLSTADAERMVAQVLAYANS